jgi:hypothetical protein
VHLKELLVKALVTKIIIFPSQNLEITKGFKVQRKKASRMNSFKSQVQFNYLLIYQKGNQKSRQNFVTIGKIGMQLLSSLSDELCLFLDLFFNSPSR